MVVTIIGEPQGTDFSSPPQISRFAITRFAPTPARWSSRMLVAALLIAATITGCDAPDPIVTYTIDTKVPEPLRAGKDRMLAAMLPKGDQVWFIKVSGPEQAVEGIESTFREFVRTIEFIDDVPALKNLPEQWRRGGEKPMRFASINVETPNKQLDISISNLTRQDDWNEQVSMNVNRWRGQLNLSPSKAKWAEGEEFEIAAADSEGIWVDLLGEPSGGASSMTPPFAGGPSTFAGGPSIPRESQFNARPPQQAESSPPDPRLKFDRPEGWRDGRMSSMRMAAFNVGPEDSPAELTVIPAGGDLRGNVARWLGQVRAEEVPAEVVDKALADAQQVDVDGRSGQRFLLTGEDPASGTAIDATIVPMDGGISLFVKMTGPAKTVSEQSDAIASFLDSLELNL
jgi:hypothetical protein